MYSHLLTALEEGERRRNASRNGNGNVMGDGGTQQNEGPRKKKALPSLEEAACAAASLRISICGSAACPVPLARRWDELVERGKRRKAEDESRSPSSSSPSALSSSPASPASSSSLLERYGMTEAGMILGQSLEGSRARGVVGRPMPGVEVKLLRRRKTEENEADGGGEEEERVDSLERGLHSPPLPAATEELLVRWPGMFSAYWGRGKETREAFLEDEEEGGKGKWFATGDVALRSSSSSTPSSPSSTSSQNKNDYRLLGRVSVDILKVGGEKVSALEVEDALLAHERIAEAAVVAVDGGEKGDAVAAVLVSSSQPLSSPLPTLDQLREFVAEVLPKAALPSRIVFVEALPRNAMGKVDKRRAREEAFGGKG